MSYKIIDLYICVFIFNLTRFKIKVQVEDNIDDVPLILFHPLADKIIEKDVLNSAAQLLKENSSSDVEEVMFHVDLDKLIGKMFAFKIEITTYNMTNFDEMYLVTNMTDDESIINELKEKMKITEVFFISIHDSYLYIYIYIIFNSIIIFLILSFVSGKR
ncbi:hypothetical protein Hanom_Chr12g01142081 [Helianthus anomalus]